MRVADHHGEDVATAVKQYAHLALDIAGDLGEGTREFGGDDAVGTAAAVGQTFQPAQRGSPQPTRVTCETNGRFLAKRNADPSNRSGSDLQKQNPRRKGARLALKHDTPDDFLAFHGIEGFLGLSQL